MSFTQVVSVQSSTISGITIVDSTEVSFGKSQDLPTTRLHKVDNGIAYLYEGSFTDFSFGSIPDVFMPHIAQSMFQWRVDLLDIGITNSYAGAAKAAYLKTLVKTESGQPVLSYKPTCDYLRPNTVPWTLYTTLPTSNFRAFDSIKLYNDMASRGFSYGEYSVDYLSISGNFCTVSGDFAAVPLSPADISPTHYLGHNDYYVNKVIQPNQVTELFWPAYWIPQTNSDGSGFLASVAKINDNEARRTSQY